MPAFNGNSAFLSVNGYTIADAAGTDPGIWRNVSFSFAIDTEDTTAGAGRNWKTEAHKLGQIEGEITIVYQASSVSSDVTGILGTFGTDVEVDLLYGPEGQTAGEPWNEMKVVINNIDRSEQTHEKGVIEYTISFRSSGEPTACELFGDTYSI
jgi:hypothetical protein